MPEHILNYSLTLQAPRAAVFAFFSDAMNLGRLTPPELEFAILSPLPIEMREGATIEYRMKLYGIRFTWKAKITAWSAPNYFVDEQLEGPYRQWIHRHTFRDGPGGCTIMEDEVHFLLPRFSEGALPMVRKELERIFLYRQEAVQDVFPHPSSTG